MRLKQLSLILAATGFSAATAFADTITWTGGAGTSDYFTDGNWDLKRNPTETDDVVIDGAQVTANGSQRIPNTLTLLNGASYTIGGEIQFGNVNVEHPIIYGGTVSGTLVASQLAGSSLTISDAAIIDEGTGNNGFWQNGTSYLNFVDGTSFAASFTFKSSLNADAATNPYWFFSHDRAGTLNLSNPLIRYNNQVIDEATYLSKFQATNNGNGYVTISLKSQDGWSVAAPVLGAVENGQVEVSFTVTKYSGGNATVSIGCASTDLGDDIADWSGSLTQVATGVSDTTDYNKTVTLADGVNYIRVFVSYDSTTAASSAAVARSIVYGDYGALTGVYEYIGADGNLSTASNWALDKAPLGSGDTAPTAGSDIRWFGSNTVFALSGNFHLYATDHFVGATITQASAGNRDSNLNGDVTFENSSVTLSTVVVQSEPHVISLKNSNFATTRAPDGVAGFWTTVPVGGINFISGFPSTFSFGTDAGDVHDAATVKSQLVDKGKITLDGEAIGEDDWATYFTVVVDGNTAEIIYDPVVHADNIAGVSASDITDNSATLTAQVTAMTSGAKLYLAYGTSEPADADVLADSDSTAAVLGVNSRSVTGLDEGTTYHFRFALSVDGETILASRSGTFIPKQYDATCIDGVWSGGTSGDLTGTDKRILVTGNLVRNGEIATPNKTFENGVVSAKTLINGSAPIIAHNVKFLIDRTDNLSAAPYSLYPPDPNKHFIDFRHDAPSNNTFFTAAAYTFNYNSSSAHKWNRPADEDVFAYLFGGGRFLVDGSTVTSESAQGIFTIVDNPNEPTKEMVDEEEVEVTSGKLTLTTTDDFPADAKGDWTVRDGAYIQLSANVSVDNLIIEGSNAVIDLNGRRLKAVSLTVNGTPVERGSYADASTVSPVFKNGKLIVGADGFRVSIR